MSEPRSVMSPCVNICVIDAHTGLCAGCQRTRTEIENWTGYTPAQKLDILGQLDERLRLNNRAD